MTPMPEQDQTRTVPASAADPASIEGFLLIVDRLEAVVEAENDSLRRNPSAGLGGTSHRKRQGLLELARSLRVLAAQGPQAAVRERLERFSAKLEVNRAILAVHLGAVRGVADIIARAMREAESDGTYSMAFSRP